MSFQEIGAKLDSAVNALRGGKVGKFAKNTLSLFEKHKRKIRHRHVMEAVTAIAYQMALSDGSVDDSERQALVTFVKSDEILRDYDLHDVLETWHDLENAQAFDPVERERLVWKYIRSVNKDSNVDKVLQVAVGVAKADGRIDPGEVAFLREVVNNYDRDPEVYIAMLQEEDTSPEV